MYFFSERKTSALSSDSSPVRRIAAGLAAATMVPAHGFILNNKGAYAGTSPGVSAFATGLRTFLAACAWAFMIAAGSLIYSHFVKKWQSHGLPMLPVAALVTGAANVVQAMPAAQQNCATGAGLGPGPQFQRAKSGQTSFLEEYEG